MDQWRLWEINPGVRLLGFPHALISCWAALHNGCICVPSSWHARGLRFSLTLSKFPKYCPPISVYIGFVLILLSLIANEFEHLFIYLLIIQVFPLLIWLYTSSPPAPAPIAYRNLKWDFSSQPRDWTQAAAVNTSNPSHCFLPPPFFYFISYWFVGAPGTL